MKAPEVGLRVSHIRRLCALMAVITLSGQGAPQAVELDLQHTWRAEDDKLLEELDEDLAARVRWIQEELWQRGHAARIARGKRTTAAQREGFLSGHSKTLRSKHLCGKAVDFKLHPHDYPEVDDPFWDVKAASSAAAGW